MEKIRNLLRYTERVKSLTINVGPTGKDDNVNIQAAIEFLSGKPVQPSIDSEAFQGISIKTIDRRRWKLPWQKKRIVERWAYPGGTVQLSEGTYYIDEPIGGNITIAGMPPPTEEQLKGMGYTVKDLE